MVATSRRQKMLNYIWKHRELLTNQAVELFNISPPTVRRDFSKLVQHHPSIIRTHGGVKLCISDVEQEFEFDIKLNLHSSLKQEIAAKAFAQIQANDCVFIDSGSTCYELAKYLSSLPLTVITTDLKIAELLAGFRDINLYIVGGNVRTGFFSIGSDMACEILQQFTAHKCFMSCDAISLDAGVTNASMFEVSIKKTLIKQSQNVYMMADITKLETIASYSVASLSTLKYLITNSNIDANLCIDYQKRGLTIL